MEGAETGKGECPYVAEHGAAHGAAEVADVNDRELRIGRVAVGEEFDAADAGGGMENGTASGRDGEGVIAGERGEERIPRGWVSRRGKISHGPRAGRPLGKGDDHTGANALADAGDHAGFGLAAGHQKRHAQRDGNDKTLADGEGPEKSAPIDAAVGVARDVDGGIGGGHGGGNAETLKS